MNKPTREARPPTARFARRGCILLLSLALAACGGGSGSPAPEPPDDGGSGRAATMAQLEAVSVQVADADPDTQAQALIEAARARPDVVAAGTEGSGSMWLRHADGTTVLVPTVPRYRPSDADLIAAQAPASRAASAPARPRRERPADAWLAGSRSAYILDGASATVGLASPVQTIAGWFRDQGYAVHASLGDVDPSMMFSIRDASVLYLAGHGDPLRLADGTAAFAIQTPIRHTAEAAAVWAPYRRANEAVIVWALDPASYIDPARKGQRIEYIGITPSFVRNRMRFADGSLVMLNSCGAHGAHPAAQEMIRAFIDGAKASVVLGWDNTVLGPLANDSAYYLFDRLLSPALSQDQAGATPPYSAYLEAVQNRPFSVRQVFDAMARRERARYHREHPPEWGKLTLQQSALFLDPVTKARIDATLRMTVGPQPGVTFPFQSFGLAPEIKSVALSNADDEVTLSGRFGRGPEGGSQARVTLDGQPLDVKSWSPTTIVGRLAKAGAGSSGRLQVVVDGAKSNPTWVHQWLDVPFTLTDHAGTPEGASGRRLQCLLTVRAALDRYRAEPDGAPDAVGATTDEPVVGHCTYTAFGSATITPGVTQSLSIVGPEALRWLSVEERLAPTATRYVWVSGNLERVAGLRAALQLTAKGWIDAASGEGVKVTWTQAGHPDLTWMDGLHLAESSQTPVIVDDRGRLLAGTSRNSSTPSLVMSWGDTLPQQIEVPGWPR